MVDAVEEWRLSESPREPGKVDLASAWVGGWSKYGAVMCGADAFTVLTYINVGTSYAVRSASCGAAGLRMGNKARGMVWLGLARKSGVFYHPFDGRFSKLDFD